MKRITLLSLAVVTAMIGFAQNQPMGSGTGTTPMLRTPMETKVRFGLKAGVNLATLEIDDDSQSNPYNTNNKTGFHGGAFVNIPIGGMLRFQPEILYSTQGSKIEQSNSPLSGTTRDEWDMHYIQIPLMIQYQTMGGFFVEAGPHVAYQTKGERDNGTEIPDLKKFDYGIGGGIGYLSRIGLGVGARYNFGFANISDNDATGNDEGKYKNRVLQIGLVYQFGAYK